MTERSRTIDSVRRGEYVPTADQRIVLGGLSWSDFEAFVDAYLDQLGIRNQGVGS